MTTKTESICKRCDAGEFPEAIAAAEDVSVSYVCGVLREHRPNRPRKPRKKTSTKPDQMRALAAGGATVPRIAFLLQVEPAYVYRVLGESGK